MLQKIRFTAIVKPLVVGIILIIAVSGVYISRGLYADGSFFLFNILSGQGYWNFDHARSFAQIATQTPVVLAIKSGEVNVNHLVYLHSFGLIGIPILAWFFSCLIHIKSDLFWFFSTAFSITYLTSGFFSIGEYNLAYALTAYCLAILLTDKKLNFFYLLGLVLSSLILVKSYESMVFLGPLLFLFALRRYQATVSNLNRTNEKIVILTSSFLFLLSSSFAALSIVYPRDPSNLAAASNFSSLTTSSHFIFTFIFLLIYLLIDWLDKKIRTIALICATLISLIYIQNAGLWNPPSMHYMFRTISGLVFFLLILILYLQTVFHRNSNTAVGECSRWPKSFQYSSVIAFLIFLSFSIPSIVHDYKFFFWIKEYRVVAASLPAWVPIDETKLYSDRKELYDLFAWSWSNPSLSLILRGDESGGLLNSRLYKGWQPFDPEQLQDNPLQSFHETKQ
ncbi:hypothetical protein VZG28_05425 [Synechococcus elongatus IITB4]|uniref:hypothetical protein n=1 Tax=Synechococcus elongatus TaxID=32046 RepID=UPI0030CB76A9